jgi:hypothetical protein
LLRHANGLLKANANVSSFLDKVTNPSSLPHPDEKTLPSDWFETASAPHNTTFLMGGQSEAHPGQEPAAHCRALSLGISAFSSCVARPP